ncbi:MAG: hypothetical protein FJX75_06395 [Armatimonadetes bacterium]|nr:hypothetical protein [Armatimonadota bacterium]
MSLRCWTVFGIAFCASAGLLDGSAARAQDDSLPAMRARLRQMIHASHGAPEGEPAGEAVSDVATATYHSGTMLHCENCHVMHASDSGQGYNGPAKNPGGYPHLLRASNPTELCLSCHDGHADVPDVVGADTNGLAERAGGMFASPGAANPNGHKLGPGGTDLCLRCHTARGTRPGEAEVTCTDCHDAHGNGRARNLQWASDPPSTPPLGLFVNPTATDLARYERSNVAYGTDGTDNLREVTNICIDCHHVFSGSWYTDPDGDGIPNKHPVTETERGATIRVSDGDSRHTTDSGHWVDGSGAGFGVPRARFLVDPATTYSEATAVAADNTVFCLTCHKAHGSENPDGLAWPQQNGSVGPNGCDQCHNKGAS